MLCGVLQFWPRQLLKKWLSFHETGDDFERDNDPNAEIFSESEDFDDSDGKLFFRFFVAGKNSLVGLHLTINLSCAFSGIEGSGDDDTRELTESDPDTDAISTAG